MWRQHIAKDYSDSVEGNPLQSVHGLLFAISKKSFFICTERITHATTFVTPEIVQWVHHKESFRRTVAPRVGALPWHQVKSIVLANTSNLLPLQHCVSVTHIY